jgi:hypothetical protein
MAARWASGRHAPRRGKRLPLTNAFPIPGMDAMMFDLACSGEGMTYDGGKVILVPTQDGLGLVRDGFVTTWLRCP